MAVLVAETEFVTTTLEEMLASGWLEEVRALLAGGASPSLEPMKAIGYRELVAYITEGGDLEETAEAIKQSTRRFAKRQLTWFRRMEGERVAPPNFDKMVLEAKNFLQIS